MITGGDMIAARRMKEDFWMMDPTWHIHVSFNDPPTISGTDDGIRRRLKIIPWSAKFEGANKDNKLKERLESEQHRAAMLNWCLEWIRDYFGNGVPTAVAVAAATDQYVAEQDTLGTFLEECCDTEWSGSVRFNDFMAAYYHWLEARGENPRAWSGKRLGNELQRRGFNKHRPNAGPDRSKTVYTGLTMLVAPPSTF